MRKAKEKNASGEERKMDEKSVVEKVSKAIASGEIDDSRVIKDDEDDRESIVEKDQIEEMETSPINHHDKDFVKVEEADESPPKELDLEKAPPKVAYSHVKTPDEVDDLPEHEVVNPDESMLEEIKSEMSYDLEEKIAKDESEKENEELKKDRSEGSIEALKENEEVEVLVEQKHIPVTKAEKKEASEQPQDEKNALHADEVEKAEEVKEIKNAKESEEKEEINEEDRE